MLKKNNLLIFVFIASLLVNVIGINKQGETWDEIAYYNAAKSYYRNLYHFNFSPDDWVANKEHPAVGKWLLGLGSLKSFDSDEISYTGGRVVNAALAAAAAGLAVLIV